MTRGSISFNTRTLITFPDLFHKITNSQISAEWVDKFPFLPLLIRILAKWILWC